MSNNEEQLNHIAEILMINGTLLPDPGLINGQLGIVIFFFYYARYTGESLYEEYAYTLIDEIQKQIHANSPASYAKGIAGIGVGIDYLIQKGFLEAGEDTYDDPDQRMFRAVMYEPCSDFSFYFGLSGYGRYWMKRLQQFSSANQASTCLKRIVERMKEKLPDMPVGIQPDVYCFLYDLSRQSGFEFCHSLLEKCSVWDLRSVNNNLRFPRLGDTSVSNYARVCLQGYYFDPIEMDRIKVDLNQLPDLNMEESSVDPGILSGYAGEGLLRLTMLNHSDLSWMFLL